MWHNDGYDLRSLMLGMVKMRFLLVFSIAILFSGCAVHGDMPVLSGVLTNGTYGTSASNHSRVLSNALPLTVVAAILLFLVKEIVELFKKVREKSRKISAYKGLLAEELLKIVSSSSFSSLISSTISGCLRLVIILRLSPQCSAICLDISWRARNPISEDCSISIFILL